MSSWPGKKNTIPWMIDIPDDWFKLLSDEEKKFKKEKQFFLTAFEEKIQEQTVQEIKDLFRGIKNIIESFPYGADFERQKNFILRFFSILVNRGISAKAEVELMKELIEKLQDQTRQGDYSVNGFLKKLHENLLKISDDYQELSSLLPS